MGENKAVKRLIIVGGLACREEECPVCELRKDEDLCLKLKAEKNHIPIRIEEE